MLVVIRDVGLIPEIRKMKKSCSLKYFLNKLSYIPFFNSYPNARWHSGPRKFSVAASILDVWKTRNEKGNIPHFENHKRCLSLTRQAGVDPDYLIWNVANRVSSRWPELHIVRVCWLHSIALVRFSPRIMGPFKLVYPSYHTSPPTATRVWNIKPVLYSFLVQPETKHDIRKWLSALEVAVVYFKIYLLLSLDIFFVFFFSYFLLKMSPLRLGRGVLTDVWMIMYSGREQKQKL